MDDMTLSGVGLTALTQGVSFLYAQAGELLRRRRERLTETDQQPDSTTVELPPVAFPAGIFNQQPNSDGVIVGRDLIDEVAPRLRALRQSLLPYTDDTEDLDRSSVEVLNEIDELRRILEAIYGRPITFVGESPRSNPTPSTTINVNTQYGGVRAKTIKSGIVVGHDYNERYDPRTR